MTRCRGGEVRVLSIGPAVGESGLSERAVASEDELETCMGFQVHEFL